MIDPVVMDLNRHMAQLDRETQIEEATEELELDILHEPEKLGEALADLASMNSEQWDSLYVALSLLATADRKDAAKILEAAKRVRCEIMELAERRAIKLMERRT